MYENNILLEKSYRFTIRIVKLFKHFSKEKNAMVLSNQILKSGTSIGANLEEAVGAQSRKDFLSKIYISYKETRETYYWIRLLRDTDYLTKNEANSLIKDCEELLKLLGKSISTIKKNNS